MTTLRLVFVMGINETLREEARLCDGRTEVDFSAGSRGRQASAVPRVLPAWSAKTASSSTTPSAIFCM